MSSEESATSPKFACKECGNDEVRGDFDTYPVFSAEDDKIVFLRTELTDTGVMELYCNSCGEEIDEDLDGITIE